MNTPGFQFDPESARFGASRSQKRVEDARLLTGRGLFSDDRTLPGEAWLAVLRSPHAHARLVSIDASAARTAPGVVAVWSNADLRADGVRAIPFPPLFKRADGSPMAIAPRYPLADDAVRYVGQPVVAIVAATRRQAQDAAEQVVVEYDELPCVVDARHAIEPGAPQLWPDAPGNVCAESRFGDPAAVDAAFARAAHVVSVALHNQRLAAFPLEPRAAIAAHAHGPTTR
jgi:carbon-monoxide dehydrogenase large subunit